MRSIGILDTASYLPSKINTNEDVCANIEGLTPEWIIEKTGIKKRHHAEQWENTSFMGGWVANQLALKIDPKEIGLIIVASYSQHYMLPAMASGVHLAVGAQKDCQIIDINVNCVGLITATTIAVERMRSDSSIKYALVIGAEILSWYVDKTDKFTAPFFSDGASGVLLGDVKRGYGFINAKFCTDSSAYEDVRLTRGGFIEHNGKATWTQAITNVPYVLREVVENIGYTLNDIDFIVFHQANKVLIDYIMDKSKIPYEKTYTNVQEIGNTGSASIGIALNEAMNKELIHSGDYLALAGVGAGFNFGANLWRMQ
jgi:3-oxoacyl-[acyl-carrier-protein] synthase-3